MSSVTPLIHVQTQDFDVGAELRRLQALTREVGAVASFVGYVRDSNQGDGVTGMTLEHYPGMTEKALADICQRAQTRWPLLGLTVIHRVGPLAPGEQIVLVAVASRHRDAAFEACRFIMDFLKNVFRRPFLLPATFPHSARSLRLSLQRQRREFQRRWRRFGGCWRAC